MQHLAKVYRKSLLGGAKLQLIARQASEATWELVKEDTIIDTSQPIPFSEGILVLVTLDDQQQIVGVEEATDWVLGLVSQYLTQGFTPELLQQEIERAEQWRQSLTLQSQEVRRRSLETVARRDEIQALEKRLRLEREEVERRESELKAKLEAVADADGNPAADSPTLESPA